MPHPFVRRLFFIVTVALLAGCGGGGGSTPVAPATTTVTTWWDAERIRPQATGAIRVDAAGNALHAGDGAELRIGEWRWFYDLDGSPLRRVERFADDGSSLGWTEYNADAVDPVTRRGSIRDDSTDAVPR